MSSDLDKNKCAVCSDQMATTIPSGGFEGIHQNCPRCGEFKISGTANALIHEIHGGDKRAKMSGWVRTQNRNGTVPTITNETLQRVSESPLPSVVDRAYGILIEAESGMKGLGERFNILEPRFLAASYSSSMQDVHFLLSMLRDQRLAEAKNSAEGCEILPDGYMRLEELKRKTSISTKGFVAMSFQEELNDIYSKGFQLALVKSGYEPTRMDKVEHINRIDDEIINQINTSRFVVADFTGHRGGVYFEAGYAMGLGLPIFWTCRKNEMSELHFDIRQFNCIDWETAEDLAQRLQSRIESVLGKGPR
jgi:nucleoside 2-deoxyribosyltransferase